MNFQLTFAPTADQSFSLLPRRVQLQFNLGLRALEQDPRQGTADLDDHQLYGYQNVWTLRIQSFRGIYAIDGADVVMVIFGHRDTVYSSLHNHIPPRRQAISKTSLDRRR